MRRTILHIDFDSFFASCEQHFNPNLRHKPIGITAENGRNAVIAASREAKKKGVKSPNTTWEAKRICPEIVFVKADFERYLEITKKLLSIATTYSPVIELFSLDEVFMDLTPVTNLYPSPMRVVEDFKKRLREEVGTTITVSAGASYNKILAKLATNLNKPDGYAEIDSKNKKKIFSSLELTDIMGIGGRYKRRLNMLGIFTFADLEKYPLPRLRHEFGNVASQHLKALSMGIDDTPVISYTESVETKSVGRNYCLPKNEYDHAKILKTIYELCEEIAIKLRRLGMQGRTIGLYLHGNEGFGQRLTLAKYTSSGKDLFDVCERFFNKWRPEYIRQVSVYMSNLVEEQYVTPSLFESPQRRAIAALVDQVNDKFGHHTIRSGYVVDTPKLHTKPNGFMADRWQRNQLRNLSGDNYQ
ncbi:MAG TPA: DNA polymerase IV [Patescibacteria group bacterium]|nr:DNA polymerase IV [Patescibacteria group bacterium]